jgi:hypothetical protein
MAESEQQFHALVGKALSDPEFRARLMSQDKGEQLTALRSVGIQANEGDAVMGKLADAIKAVDDLAAGMGGQVAS